MNNPIVQDFKAYFTRDFPYGTTSDTVNDLDIQKAIDECAIMINEDLFTSQDSYTLGFLNLSAHYMVTNLRNSSQGVMGQFSWLQSSKSVGSVSEAISIPQRILDNPELSMLAKTNYGAKFLFMILPQLTGQIFTVHGRTHA